MSKPQFLAEAGAICKRAEGQKEQAISSELAAGKPSKQSLEKLIKQAIVPDYRKALTELRRLKAPAGDQRAVEGILAGYESALEDTEHQPDELIEGDPFTDAEQAAQQYGLGACVF